VKKPIPKDKLILIGLPLFGLLIGLLGYVALVSPQKSKANSLSSQIELAKTQAAASKSKPKPKPVPVHAADILRLTKAMPDAPNVAGVIIDLELVARESSIVISGIKPSPPIPQTEGYGTLPVAVTVSGTFPQLSGFLHRLRRQAWIGNRGVIHVDGRLLVADQLALTADTDGVISATLNFNAFVYGLVAPPPAPTTTDASGSTTTTPNGGGA